VDAERALASLAELASLAARSTVERDAAITCIARRSRTTSMRGCAGTP
jgi:hypothetical protein